MLLLDGRLYEVLAAREQVAASRHAGVPLYRLEILAFEGRRSVHAGSPKAGHAWKDGPGASSEVVRVDHDSLEAHVVLDRLLEVGHVFQ